VIALQLIVCVMCACVCVRVCALTDFDRHFRQGSSLKRHLLGGLSALQRVRRAPQVVLSSVRPQPWLSFSVWTRCRGLASIYVDVPNLTAKRNWPWQSSLTHEFVEQRKAELLAWLQLLLADEMIRGLWPLRCFLSDRRNIPPPGVLQPETAVGASGSVSRSPSHSREVGLETVGPESFSQIKLLGTGASGTVMQVRQNNTGNIYAMKAMISPRP
jgi:hypothetical protein